MSRVRKQGPYLSPDQSFGSELVTRASSAMPPKASVRQRNATPARSTRAATTALQDTPGTRRSTRGGSRQPIATKDVVSNPALPEIQTQQSYAYGSSKTPALPEQLHARDLSMHAVANRLNAAADEAERNFEARAAEVRGSASPDSQAAARESRAQRRASKEPVLISSQTLLRETPEDVRKQSRTADWINSSQLDEIPEEDSEADGEPQTPERDRGVSEPSSFPTGSFDHSYNYERGERGPRLPQPEPDLEPEQEPEPRRSREAQPLHRQESVIRRQQRQKTPLWKRTKSKISWLRVAMRDSAYRICLAVRRSIQRLCSAVWHWIYRMIQMMQKSLLEIPDSPVTSILFKSLIVLTVVSISGFLLCTVFTYTCDANSTSIVSQSFQTLCGQCRTSNFNSIQGRNLTTTNPNDMSGLLSALQQTQKQIAQIETRLNSKIDSSHASHSADTAHLRVHQDSLEQQIRRLKSQRSSSASSSSDVPSPLIGKINFFSPSSGATIIPHLTSPTRTQAFWFPYKLGLRMLGLRKSLSPPPITALEPWLDEGDCWCAAEVDTDNGSSRQHQRSQDSIRLAVQVSQQIYPTELVIEHFPSTGSLEPGLAPKDIEIWADFAGLTYTEWQRLHIEDLVSESPDSTFLPKTAGARTWAKIGIGRYAISSSSNAYTGESGGYEMSADETYGHVGRSWNPGQDVGGDDQEVGHVQRFNLAINQHGLLHYSDRFLVRVRNNHGAGYTCLYRVRLHGMPREDRHGSKG